jgi:hypothetical protein
MEMQVPGLAASSTAPVLTASKTPRSSAATKQRLATSSQVASRPPAPRSTAPTAAVRSSASGGAYRRPRSSPGVSRFTRSTATLTTTSV